MSKTVEKVRAFIERCSMLRGSRGVVVAVSGGPDSVALLDILARVSGPHLHIAHMNHKLRGRDSDEDAEFMRLLAEQFGLPLAVYEADVRAEAEREGRGIEEIAREIRYGFLLRVARENSCDRIATGHTMSDQAETFLMRLARGAGLRGLASMRPLGPAHRFASWTEEGEGEGGERVKGEKRKRGKGIQRGSNDQLRHPIPPLTFSPDTVLLVRPLLGITREEVEAYCLERGLKFRTDATNLCGDYTRNRVRREVLPRLRAINPRVVESIARAAEIISNDEDSLDYLASKLLDAARVGRGIELATDEAQEARGEKERDYEKEQDYEKEAGLFGCAAARTALGSQATDDDRGNQASAGGASEL
jgi:tRNA(Ile)-lysidine synthetase-like protein